MTKLIAVIHHLDDITSLENARIAFDAGFEGVCMIDMNGRDGLLDRPGLAIKERWADRLVITNRLVMSPEEMIDGDAKAGFDGSWCDNPGITSRGRTELTESIRGRLEGVRAANPEFLFFGSVAFKTQRPDPDPPRAAVIASQSGFIATTSGTATGVAPDVAKLRSRRMRSVPRLLRSRAASPRRTPPRSAPMSTGCSSPPASPLTSITSTRGWHSPFAWPRGETHPGRNTVRQTP